MDIANKTRCFRQSKRFDLFSGQWEAKRLENHRKKVENARPRIDVETPKSANFQHVKVHKTVSYINLCGGNIVFSRTFFATLSQNIREMTKKGFPGCVLFNLNLEITNFSVHSFS